MDELRGRISELEKARDDSTKTATAAKAEVEHVEQLWAESAYEIKILDQCRVICLDADFSKVGLDKIVVDGHIEVALDEGDEGVGVPESEHVNPASDP